MCREFAGDFVCVGCLYCQLRDAKNGKHKMPHFGVDGSGGGIGDAACWCCGTGGGVDGQMKKFPPSPASSGSVNALHERVHVTYIYIYIYHGR